MPTDQKPDRATIAQMVLEARGLAVAAKGDPGKPFEPDNLDLLCAVKVLAPADFERVHRLLKDAKVRVGELDRMIAKESGPGVDASGGADASPPDLAELETAAGEIPESDDILGLFAADYAKLIAGEEANGKLLYLVATSRLFAKCMHAAVKGTSASGKSELRNTVLTFFPPEDVIEFATMSERALLYEERGFEHKILSMGEAAGSEEGKLQDYLLRELMSAGRLIYKAPQKVGGDIVTVTIEKHGPVAFMVTTTRADLFAENETRIISLETSDSEAQTQLVLDKVAQLEGEGVEPNLDLERWQNFQRWLAAGNCRVVIPFARELAKLIPAKSVRLRRDIGQLLRAVKAHALLHRASRTVDAKGRVVAGIADYEVVRNLLADIIAAGAETKMSPTVAETVKAVASLQHPSDEAKGVAPLQVAKQLDLDRSAARRRLQTAAKRGYVVNLETEPRRPGRYRTTPQAAEQLDLLPSVEALMAALERPVEAYP